MNGDHNPVILPHVSWMVFARRRESKAEPRDAGEDNGYLSPSAPVESVKAPNMKVRLLAENGGVRSYAIVLAKGAEVMSGLTDFARQYRVASATFTAIGGLSRATLAWFDKSRKEFKPIPIRQTVELISMIGDIALSGEQPVVHTQVSVASSGGMLRGGRLIEADVFPTLELFMTVYPTALYRQSDEATGLKLIDPLLK